MVKVLVRDNNVEQALRVAKRKSQKEGLYREMKERQRYEKPTTKRKRLKEENRFFEKKMEILQNGFRELEEDRRQFEREKLRFETERKVQRENFEYTGNVTRAQVFFRGVTNQLALKKRYKDLMKIFHPDNLCGDNETVLAISKEYEKLRKEYDYHKEA